MSDQSIFRDFHHTWMSRFPQTDVPDIWVGDLKVNLSHHKAKVVSLREELEKEELCVEYLEYYSNDVVDEVEDLNRGENVEAVEEGGVVDEVVKEGGEDSTQDNDKHMGVNTDPEPMSTETTNASSQQDERVNITNGGDLIELSVCGLVDEGFDGEGDLARDNDNPEPMSTETSNTSSQRNERVNDTNGDDLIGLSMSSYQNDIDIFSIGLEVGNIHEAGVLVDVQDVGVESALVDEFVIPEIVVRPDSVGGDSAEEVMEPISEPPPLCECDDLGSICPTCKIALDKISSTTILSQCQVSKSRDKTMTQDFPNPSESIVSSPSFGSLSSPPPIQHPDIGEEDLTMSDSGSNLPPIPLHGDETKTQDLLNSSNYLCSECGKGFQKNWMLKRHTDAAHPVSTFECDICFKTFKSRKACYDHKSRSHKSKLCENCNVEVKASSFPTHVKKCLNIAKSYSCEHCEYKTIRRRDLTRHMKTHWEKEKHMYYCDKCDYSSKKKGHLKEHMKSHYKFECKSCNCKFRKVEKLNNHVSRMHASITTSNIGFMMEVDQNGNNERNVRQIKKVYQCQKCPYKSKHKHCLTRHMIVHLPARAPNQERLCIHCKLEFPAYKLKKHMKGCAKPLRAVFSKELTLQMLRTTNISIRDVRKWRRMLKAKFGIKSESNIDKKITEAIREEGEWWNVSDIWLEGKKGKPPIKTCVSYIKDLPKYLKHVCQGRKYLNPKFAFAGDSGQGKFILTVTITDLSDPNDEEGDYKNTGKRRTLVILQCDKAIETHANVDKLIELMKFPDLDVEYTFTADLKMVNLSVGLSSCNCIHSCPYCEGAKWAFNKKGEWKKTNKFGQYFPGKTRTLGSIKLNNRRFIVHGKGLNAPKYKNCVRNVVGLWSEDMDHVRTLSLFPIDPLHVLLLGPINDLIPILRDKFPKQIDDFLARHNLKNNEGIGGTFAGPSIRKLLTEELLVDLQSSLQSQLVDDQAVALPVVQYLRALRELYHVCVAKHLDGNFESFIEEYRLRFTALFQLVKLPWTLKQHIILEHLGEYFSLHRVTLRATSGEYIESVHSSLRRLEELHGLHTETKIGTKSHRNRILKSSCLFNFKNEGFRMMNIGVPHNITDEFWSEDHLC